MLDPNEQARASRFVSALDRREFVACHALLRMMLSQTVDCLPHEVMFSLGSHGKPSLAAEHRLSDLQFNISHTRGLVAAGVAWGCHIGVDVQIFESCSDQLDLAQRFFAPEEAELVRAASIFDRPRVFAQIWTLKEAYIKAIGIGLSAPLDGFAFSLDPPMIEFLEESSHRPDAWRFMSSLITEQHVLSVALHAASQQPEPVMLTQVSGEELQAILARLGSRGVSI